MGKEYVEERDGNYYVDLGSSKWKLPPENKIPQMADAKPEIEQIFVRPRSTYISDLV